jgi:hypothetical protein
LSYCDANFNNISGIVFNETDYPYIWWHNSSLNLSCPVRVNNTGYLISFACKRNQLYCQPVGQNNASGIPIINYTNLYGYAITTITARLNTTYTNITVMITNQFNPTGAINASTIPQTISGVLAEGGTVPIYMWANYTNVLTGGTFRVFLENS